MRTFRHPIVVLALAAILVLAGLRVWQNTRVVALRATDAARQAAAATATQTLYRAIGAANRRARFTRAEVESQFNGGRPIATRVGEGEGTDADGRPNGVTYAYDVGAIFDPTTFARVDVSFRDGLLSSWGASGGVPVPPSPMPPLWAEATAIHGRLVYDQAFAIIWVVGMLSLARDMDRDRRVGWLVALFVVAVAWAAAVATLSKWWLDRFRFFGDMEYWLWPPLALAANAFFLRETLRGPRDASRCASCGYDLTGNVSGVCPECGTRRRAATVGGAGGDRG